MKKALLAAFIFIILITLSACNKVSQDELSLELCYTNPDNELCSLENVKNLDEHVVSEFIDSIFDNELDNDCDAVFEKHPLLKATCESKSTGLIPSDITTFTILTISEDEESYVITGESNLENIQLVIYVRIVSIDDELYMDFWYPLTDQIKEGEISDASASAYITDYFTSMTDKTITGAAFCSLYYEGLDDDCDGLLEDDVRIHDDITVLTVERIQNNHFLATIEASKSTETSGSSPTQLDVDFYLTRTDYGPIFTSNIVIQNTLSLDEVKEQMDGLFIDYSDSTLSNELFCNIYYDNSENDCEDLRTTFLLYNNDISINSITKVTEKHYKAFGTVLKSTDSETPISEDVEIDIFLDRTGLGLLSVSTLLIKAIEPVDTIKILFNDFVSTYLNADIDDNTFNSEFTLVTNDLITSVRSKSIEDIESIKTVMIIPLIDGTYDFYVKLLSSNGDETSSKINVREPQTTDNSKTILTFIAQKESDPITDIETNICNLLTDLVDPTIDTDSFDNLYIGALGNSLVLDNISDFFSCDDIVSITINEDEQSAFVVIENTINDIPTQSSIKIRYNIWEYTIIDINDIDDDCDGICQGIVSNPEEAKRAFESFINDFYGTTYTDEEINDMYFDGTMNSDYFFIRPFISILNVTANVSSVEGPDTEGAFTFSLAVSSNQGSNNDQEIRMIVTKRIEKETPLLELIVDEEVSNPN